MAVKPNQNHQETPLTKNLESLSDGGKLAIVICANAFRFGGNWGFIKSTKHDFKGQIETLKEEKPNVKAIPVSNGALILADENFLAYNVNLAVPNAIGGSFVEMAKQRREQERARFVKFLEKVVTGKTQHIKKGKGYTEVTFGVFSVNDTNLIRSNGKEYPAYKLTIIEALEYANQLSKAGKKVFARAVKEDKTEVFDLVFNLATNSKGTAALYRGLEIAESETGLFLTLRIV